MDQKDDQEFFAEIEKEEKRIITDEERAVRRGTLRYAGYSMSRAVRDFTDAVAKAFPHK